LIRVDTVEKKQDGSFTAFAHLETGVTWQIVCSVSKEMSMEMYGGKGQTWCATQVEPLLIEWQRKGAAEKDGVISMEWMRHRLEIHRPIPVSCGRFQLRMGRETDAEACLHLEKELLSAHRQLPGWEKLNDDLLYQFVFAVENDEQERRRAWESHLGPKKVDWFTFVLEGADGGLVALIHYQVPFSGFAMIYRVSVVPHLRNQGLGSIMLRHVLALHAGREIRIQVLIPAAERLYRRSGFEHQVDTMEVQGATMVTLSTERPAEPPPIETLSPAERRQPRVSITLPVKRIEHGSESKGADRKRQRVSH